jgi:hypothetical protein
MCHNTNVINLHIQLIENHNCGVMVSVLAFGAVDRGFKRIKPHLDQTKE